MTLETIIEAQEETIIEGQATEVETPTETVDPKEQMYQGALNYARQLAPVVYSSNVAIEKYILNSENSAAWDDLEVSAKENYAKELSDIVFNWPNFTVQHYHNAVHADLVRRGFKYGAEENLEANESPLCVYNFGEAPAQYRVLVNNTVSTINAFINADYGQAFPFSIVMDAERKKQQEAAESSDPLAETAEEEAVNTESVNQ